MTAVVLSVLIAGTWATLFALWLLHVRLIRHYAIVHRHLMDHLMETLTENLMLRTDLMKHSTTGDLERWLAGKGPDPRDKKEEVL